MLVVVNSVANGIEAVVVTDVKAIAEVDYICHAFTGDSVYCAARETDGEMFYYFLGNLNVGGCLYSGSRCRSRSLDFRGSRICFGRCVR